MLRLLPVLKACNSLWPESGLKTQCSDCACFWKKETDQLQDSKGVACCCCLSLQDEKLKIGSISMAVYERALRNCPWSGVLWRNYILTLERNSQPFELIKGRKLAAFWLWNAIHSLLSWLKVSNLLQLDLGAQVTVLSVGQKEVSLVLFLFFLFFLFKK